MRLSETLLLLFRGLCSQFKSLLKDLETVCDSNNTKSFLSFKEVMQQGRPDGGGYCDSRGAACEGHSHPGSMPQMKSNMGHNTFDGISLCVCGYVFPKGVCLCYLWGAAALSTLSPLWFLVKD